MKVWDLHCDTLSELRYAENDGRSLSFANNDLQMDLERMKQGDYLLQCFACFVNLGRKNENPLVSCMEMIDIFYRLLDEYAEDLVMIRTPEDIRALPGSGKIGAMLPVEEGGVCLDDIRILRNLYRLGVRMMTLTWNHENGLAWPNSVPGNAYNVWPCSPVTDHGLTMKGFEFVEEMERLHMILDVSHLSDGGFWDVARLAKKPFIASHSNCRALNPHPRSLTDEMIRALADRGGVMGLNFLPGFLTADTEETHCSVDALAAQLRHRINTGGLECAAIGTDFDGISGTFEIPSAGHMPELFDGLLKRGFTPYELDRISFRNVERVFRDTIG